MLTSEKYTHPGHGSGEAPCATQPSIASLLKQSVSTLKLYFQIGRMAIIKARGWERGGSSRCHAVLIWGVCKIAHKTFKNQSQIFLTSLCCLNQVSEQSNIAQTTSEPHISQSSSKYSSPQTSQQCRIFSGHLPCPPPPPSPE